MDHRYPPRPLEDPQRGLPAWATCSTPLPIGRVKEIANPIAGRAAAALAAGHRRCGRLPRRGRARRRPADPLPDLAPSEPAPGVRNGSWSSWGGRLVALVVDSVTEVFGTAATEAASRIRPSRATTCGARIEGVTTHDGQLVFVLGTERLRDVTDPMAPAGGDGLNARPELSAPLRAAHMSEAAQRRSLVAPPAGRARGSRASPCSRSRRFRVPWRPSC